MGKIGKQMQLNEMEQYGAVRDLSFYKMRWILKILIQALLNEQDGDFFIWLK